MSQITIKRDLGSPITTDDGFIHYDDSVGTSQTIMSVTNAHAVRGVMAFTIRSCRNGGLATITRIA